MQYKELHGVFMGTRAELLAKTEELTDRQIAIATDTGDVCAGPGLCADVLPVGTDIELEVEAVATSNVTIATGLNAGDTLGGATVEAGKVYLLAGQTAAAENGPYTAGPSPTRTEGFTTYDAIAAKAFKVKGGTQANCVYRCKSATGGTLGTTALDFQKVVSGKFSLAGTAPFGSLPKKTPILADIAIIQDSVTGLPMRVTLTELKTLITS